MIENVMEMFDCGHFPTESDKAILEP